MIKFRYNYKRYEYGKPHKNSNSPAGFIGKLRHLAGHGHCDRNFGKPGSSTNYSHYQQSGGENGSQGSSGQRKNGGFFQRRESCEGHKRSFFGGGQRNGHDYKGLDGDNDK